MQNKYLLIVALFLSFHFFAQDSVSFTNEFNSIRNELKSWDPVRGDWLAKSVEAMAFGEEIPDRTFPESFTPYQVLLMLPEHTRNNVIRMSQDRISSSTNQNQWNTVATYMNSVNCFPARGRSYGDPHLISFDGARFSFQTVGEFVLAKSLTRNIEVQVRQRAQGDDFSLNSGVAMNVNGDRLCIYADDYPDADYSTPVRLNGLSVHLTNATYFLPHGGTIRKSGQNYTVYFPNGEVVTAKIRNPRGRGFMDVSVTVLPCSVNDFTGLLGNANGTPRDDFDVSGRTRPSVFASSSNDSYFERERLAFLAKDFADIHRVTMATTLFDYPPGMSTESYTNRMYPMVYRNLNDVNPRQIDRARRLCQERGINPLDMNACIFDNSYLGIPPSPRPVVSDPTVGTVLKPVVVPRPNVNPTPPRPPKPRPKPVQVTEVKDPSRGGNNPQPIITNPNGTTTKPVQKPVYKPTPKPVYKPKPKPTPVYKPKPTPAPKPKPVVKPKPLPGGRKG